MFKDDRPGDSRPGCRLQALVRRRLDLVAKPTARHKKGGRFWPSSFMPLELFCTLHKLGYAVLQLTVIACRDIARGFILFNLPGDTIHAFSLKPGIKTQVVGLAPGWAKVSVFPALDQIRLSDQASAHG